MEENKILVMQRTIIPTELIIIAAIAGYLLGKRRVNKKVHDAYFDGVKLGREFEGTVRTLEELRKKRTEKEEK